MITDFKTPFRLILTVCLTALSIEFVSAQEAAVDVPNVAGDMIVAVGAGGTVEYEEVFAGWADQWKQVAEAAKITHHEIGRDAEKNDREKLLELINSKKVAGKSDSDEPKSPLWLVLLGHGTAERNIAKFNLRGPDVASSELKEWLADFDRPLIVIGGFSCSGAFLGELGGENRVIITATKNGAELNFSRFGGYLAESMQDLEADLDHDEQVSLLEAYLLASSKVARFYESESRLATEHSLLEDNQDGKGTSADFFVGIRAESKAKDGSALDGGVAHRFILLSSDKVPVLSTEQTAERDRLEGEIEKLRLRKKVLSTDEYYKQLEPLLIELSKLYEET